MPVGTDEGGQEGAECENLGNPVALGSREIRLLAALTHSHVSPQARALFDASSDDTT